VRRLGNPARAKQSLRFFKTGPGEYGEGDQFLGLTAPMLHALARDHQDLPLVEVKRLLKSTWHEERVLALLILVRQYASGTAEERDRICRVYLAHTKYINNWDLVDCSAEHIVGAHLANGDRSKLTSLARSKDLWQRRIAVIATFHYIKRGAVRETFKIARLLLDDEHDLIHKAVGWMLREVGKRDRAALEAFLTRYALRMPRTMLRYAIERFSPGERQKWLARQPQRFTEH
jgi:3-methyladenine DNA glycosylase AlkD